jgi:hypothetical protein
MDYKYIDQLLERYWRCETSLEEEDILRAFFSQDEIPDRLKRYKALFSYEASEPATDVLGDDFDEKVLKMVEGKTSVKARVITMPQRLRPLFKAAAVVAILLTLGNAVQVPFERRNADPISQFDGYDKAELQKGTAVAMSDSAAIDTMNQSMVEKPISNGALVK